MWPLLRLQPAPTSKTWARAGPGLRGCVLPSPWAGSAGEAFLATIQKAAEVVASAVRPGPESPGTQRPLPQGDAYQPAMTPSAGLGPPTPGDPLPTAGPAARGTQHGPSLGIWLPPRCRGPRLPGTCWGPAGAGDGEEESTPVGGGMSHLSEPTPSLPWPRGKPAAPATHETRVPGGGCTQTDPVLPVSLFEGWGPLRVPAAPM